MAVLTVELLSCSSVQQGHSQVPSSRAFGAGARNRQISVSYELQRFRHYNIILLATPKQLIRCAFSVNRSGTVAAARHQITSHNFVMRAEV